jgi:hypothetical protein
METGQLESLPKIIKFYGYRSESWPNITGAKLTGVDGPLGGNNDDKEYCYTFNNLWNKKVSFSLELIGREFEFLQRFNIIKITPK